MAAAHWFAWVIAGPQSLGKQETSFWVAGEPQPVSRHAGVRMPHRLGARAVQCWERPGNTSQVTGKPWLVQVHSAWYPHQAWRGHQARVSRGFALWCAAAIWAEAWGDLLLFGDSSLHVTWALLTWRSLQKEKVICSCPYLASVLLGNLSDLIVLITAIINLRSKQCLKGIWIEF